jgi:16S rRNA (guanine1207-N2)-methyltransferase
VSSNRSSTDPYFKKTIPLHLQGRTVELEVAHDLFSGHDVDTGTRLLLRTLAAPEHEQRLSVVDLGCGYGPLGLGLQSLVPGRSVEMVDRDALALEYSMRNAERNGIASVRACASLGWSDVGREGFDLAVCNIAAKAGEKAIRHFLLDARQHLGPSGLAAVVVIARLDELVRELLTGSEAVQVHFSRRTAGYSVYHYGFLSGQEPIGPAGEAEGAADPLAVFERDRLQATFGGLEYELRTAYSLPEFDTLAYQTKLIAERLLASRRRPRHVLVFNPGQGHLPVLAWKHLAPDRLTLAGRDLLALRFSRANAIDNGCPEAQVNVIHQVSLAPVDLEGVDLAVVALKDGQPASVNEFEFRRIATGLQRPGRLLVGGSSTAITRLESSFKQGAGHLRALGRKRSKGNSVLELAA